MLPDPAMTPARHHGAEAAPPARGALATIACITFVMASIGCRRSAAPNADGGSPPRMASFEDRWAIIDSVELPVRDTSAPAALSKLVPLSGGTMAAADYMNSRLAVLDQRGRTIRSIGRRGRGPGEFGFIASIATDGAGHLAVADAQWHRISFFDDTGRFIRSFSTTDQQARDVAFLPGGRTVVGGVLDVGRNEHVARVYDSTGMPGSGFGAPDSLMIAIAHLMDEVRVALLPSGRMAVVSVISLSGSTGPEGPAMRPWRLVLDDSVFHQLRPWSEPFRTLKDESDYLDGVSFITGVASAGNDSLYVSWRARRDGRHWFGTIDSAAASIAVLRDAPGRLQYVVGDTAVFATDPGEAATFIIRARRKQAGERVAR